MAVSKSRSCCQPSVPPVPSLHSGSSSSVTVYPVGDICNCPTNQLQNPNASLFTMDALPAVLDLIISTILTLVLVECSI